jgi:NADH:ubiquinone oxidoreductase subunit D
MKTSFFLSAFCLVALSIFLAWTKYRVYNHDISITVSENGDTYKFSAYYNVENTRKVVRYINNCIKPNSLAKSENDYFDASTSLADHTQFHIKEYPGELKIELDKRKNPTASYYRIKEMCEGIKGLLTEK